MIPYGRQDITEEDIEAVVDVLKSDHLTQGPAVPRFEGCLKSYCGSNHAIAVNSATSALHISLLALGVNVGDRVWTSPNTFVASSNAALYCGAAVDFVDIDPHTYNMCVIELEKKLELAALKKCLPKVVIPVHFAGQSCDMKTIRSLSNKFGFRVLEDASHAIGGRYKNSAIGSCMYSDITVFSFHPVKIVTTAEGGAALTNDDILAERLNLFRSHGVTRDPHLMQRSAEGPWYYEQIELGFNYRLTDMQAALGISQMSRLEHYIQRRHEIAINYNSNLADLPLKLPYQDEACHSAYHLYVVRLQLNQIKPKTHKYIFESLRSSNIMVNLHYIPVHTQPYYQKLGFKKGDFPVAEAYYSDAVSLPIYSSLSREDQSKVINIIREIV